jgi:hypothetical protein
MSRYLGPCWVGCHVITDEETGQYGGYVFLTGPKHNGVTFSIDYAWCTPDLAELETYLASLGPDTPFQPVRVRPA